MDQQLKVKGCESIIKMGSRERKTNVSHLGHCAALQVNAGIRRRE